MEGIGDIHCHILYGVDDGADSLEESTEMLKNAASDGVTVIIATPHFRHEMFEYPKKLIDERFIKLQGIAEKMGICLLIGSEYHVNSDIIKDLRETRVHSLADTKYVLCEFSHDSEFDEIKDYSRMLLANGYIPVLAHVERYKAFQKKTVESEMLGEMGVLLQINADSILGLESRKIKKASQRLLKNGVADIVASDAHGIRYRRSHMNECYVYVCKKYTKEYADRLFISNPGKIAEEAKKKRERIINNAE